ncbi:MAG TPA: hypothetical protein VIK45_16340 [Candidatus Dormibacteraeota bacterium]
MRESTRIAPVTLSRELALAALAAWQRDEDEELAQPEMRCQAAVRGHAAILALIGLAPEQGSGPGCDPSGHRSSHPTYQVTCQPARYP